MCVSTWFLSLFLVKANLDNLFLIVMGIIVFLMQCGFAFLEAGAVRSKNTVNILIKNMLDLLIAGKVYSFFHYLFLMQLNCSLSAKQDLVKWPLFSSDHFYIFLCNQQICYRRHSLVNLVSYKESHRHNYIVIQ